MERGDSIVWEALHRHMSENKMGLGDLFDTIDLNADDIIQYDEMTDYIRDNVDGGGEFATSRLAGAFFQADQNRDGVLQYDELSAALSRFARPGADASNDVWGRLHGYMANKGLKVRDIFDAIDANADGVLQLSLIHI